MHITLIYPCYSSGSRNGLCNLWCMFVFWWEVWMQMFFRDHYVEGRMRGVAPSKKIAAVQQKNVDVWVTLSAFSIWSALKWTLLLASSRFFFLNEQSKLQTHVYWCIFNHGLSIHFSRKTKKNKQKSKFLFAMQILVYFDLPEQFDWTFWK